MSNEPELTAEAVASLIVSSLRRRKPITPKKPPEVRDADARRRAIVAGQAVRGIEIDATDCSPDSEIVLLTIRHHSDVKREREAAVQLLRSAATKLGFSIIEVTKEGEQ